MIKDTFFFKPQFLLPFGVVSPYLFIGLLGVTYFEILCLLYFLALFFSSGKLKLDSGILVYFVLFFIGTTFAIINGYLNYSIPINPIFIKILYFYILALSAFNLGYWNYQDVTSIVSSRVFKLIIVFLCLFIISYPFIDNELRAATMKFYYSSNISSDHLKRIYQIRFPGLGVNANLFSFILLITFLFTFYAWLAKKNSFIYPLLIFISIAISGSKTIFILACILSLGYLYYSRVSRKNKIRFFISLLVFSSCLVIFFLFTETGKELSEKIVIINRLAIMMSPDYDVHGYGSPVAGRFELWSMGMERVKLAPFFGVAISPISDDSSTIDFCCPHNEFIAIWTFHGFIGLMAYAFLIIGFIYKNRKYKEGYLWIGIYLALIVQMTFDAAFQYARFIPFIFLIFGLNTRAITEFKIGSNI